MARRDTARTPLVLALLTVLVSVAGTGPLWAYEPPEVYVARIIATWEEQPEGSRSSVGFALSVAFVKWPSVFLRQISEHPETQKAWLASLDQHTLKYDYERGRGVWVVRQMHDLAVRWDGVRYRDVVESIRRATEHMQGPQTDRPQRPLQR